MIEVLFRKIQEIKNIGWIGWIGPGRGVVRRREEKGRRQGEKKRFMSFYRTGTGNRGDGMGWDVFPLIGGGEYNFFLVDLNWIMLIYVGFGVVDWMDWMDWMDGSGKSPY